MATKTTRQLKTGDIVSAHGGEFVVIEDARPALFTGSASAPYPLHGVSDVAIAKARCLTGRCGAYFWPGSDWVFQGNPWQSWSVAQ